MNLPPGFDRKVPNRRTVSCLFSPGWVPGSGICTQHVGTVGIHWGQKER